MDPRISFLARAAARWWLVEKGEMTIDEAFDGLVNDICERRAVEKHFNAVWRAKREGQIQAWRVADGPSDLLRVRPSKGNISNKEGGKIHVQFVRCEESKDNPQS